MSQHSDGGSDTPPPATRKRKRVAQGRFAQTVKVGVRRLLRGTHVSGVAAWIGTGVDVVTRTGVHASRLANLHLLRCLRDGTRVPALNMTFFKQCTSLVSGSAPDKIGNAALRDTYTQHYKPLVAHLKPIARTPDHKCMLEALARDMETNQRVCLRTQFLRRHRQWCRDRVCAVVPIDRNERRTPDKRARLAQRHTLTQWLFEQTVRSTETSVAVAPLRSAASQALRAKCALVWSATVRDALVDAVRECRPKMGPRPVTFQRLRDANTNAAYIPWLHHLQRHVEAHNAAVVAGMLADDGAKQRKTFALVPQRRLDRCYVSVSTTALSAYLFRHRNDHAMDAEVKLEFVGCRNESDAAKHVQSKPEWFWYRVFPGLRKVVRGSRQRFECSLRTDGVGASVAVSKDGVRASAKEPNGLITLDSDGGTQRDAPIPLLPVGPDTRVLGVDPGRRSVFTSAEDVGDERHRVTEYSRGRYLDACGARQAARKRRTWRHAAGNAYERWLLQMPSAKVATVDAYMAHVRHLATRFDECMRRNGERRVRDLRWTNYMRRQRALGDLCNVLLKDDSGGAQPRPTVVVFGAARFGSNGPVQQVRAMVRQRLSERGDAFVDLDEFRTSQLCTNCVFPAAVRGKHHHDGEAKAIEMEGPLGPRKSGAQRRSRLHGVRVCPQCRMTWNRDVNASINMLRLFAHAQVHHGARAPPFSRATSGGKRERDGGGASAPVARRPRLA